MDQFWNRGRHGIDRGARWAKTHGRGEREQVDVADPWRHTGNALGERVVIGKIWIEAEPWAPFVVRRLVAISPGRNIAGEILQFAAFGEIDLGAGAADDKIDAQGSAWHTQFDLRTRLARALDR